MRIILDMDDVLAQTNQRWIERYNEDWDDDYSLEKIKGWNIHYWVKPECGKKIYDYLNELGFYRNMEPVIDAIEGVKRLMDDGHDIIVATAAPTISSTAVEEKKEWVREHMPFFKLNNLMICHRKELLRADLLFDDGAHNLRDFPSIAICMDRPWNRGENCAEQRVMCWADFLSLIDRIHEDEKYRSHLQEHAEWRLRQLDRTASKEYLYDY